MRYISSIGYSCQPQIFVFFQKMIFRKIIIVLTLRHSAMHCSVFNFCHVNLLLFERDEMGVSHAFRVHYGKNFKFLSKNYVAFLILEIPYASRNNFTVGIGKKQYLNEDFVYSIIIDVESKNASWFLDTFYDSDHSGVSTTLCTVRITAIHL